MSIFGTGFANERPGFELLVSRIAASVVRGSKPRGDAEVRQKEAMAHFRASHSVFISAAPSWTCHACVKVTH